MAFVVESSVKSFAMTVNVDFVVSMWLRRHLTSCHSPEGKEKVFDTKVDAVSRLADCFDHRGPTVSAPG